jgi:hypothetical protein
MRLRSSTRFPVGVAAAIALAAAVSARANNAFPDEFSLHFPAGDPNTIYMGANFGLLVSTDNGATWRYACEPWIVTGSSGALANFNVNEYDLTAVGAILADVYANSNMNRSTDACAWKNVTGGVANQQVPDFFASKDDPNFVVAIVQPNSTTTYLVASHDGGQTFDSTHLVDTPKDYLFSTVEIAPSTGTVYATAYSLAAGSPLRLYSSADWTKPVIDLAASGATDARILTVDPQHPDTLYVRMIGLTETILKVQAGTSPSATPLLTSSVPLTAFLLANDGTLYAGTGTGKLYVMKTTDTVFGAALPGPHFRCLGQRPGSDLVYACTGLVDDGYNLAVSSDHGATFTKVMSFRDLQGPLTCPSVQTNCAAHWTRIQGVLFGGDGGVDIPDGGTRPDGGTGSPGGGGSGCTSVGAAGAVIALLLTGFAARRRTRR